MTQLGMRSVKSGGIDIVIFCPTASAPAVTDARVTGGLAIGSLEAYCRVSNHKRQSHLMRGIMSQAADRVLKVLEHVAASRDPMSAMTVAGDLGLDKSTCSRLLALLVERGWLVRDERTRLFSAGPSLVQLGAMAVGTNQFESILLPLLTELRRETQETVSFHRRIGNQRVCIAGLESEQVVRRALPLGDAFPLHVGPSGKTILAFMDSNEQKQIIRDAGEDASYTIRAALETVIRRGVLSTDGDHAIEVGGLSVPVFDRQGIFGSLTVAGPILRWNAGRRASAAPSLLAAGQLLSEKLGASGDLHHKWKEAWIDEGKGDRNESGLTVESG